MPEEEVKKPIYLDEYSHSSWRTEATNFENALARKLYDQQVVKQAGQTALSKVSTLLVRFNRLKRLESDMDDNFRGSRDEADLRLKNTLEAIAAQKKEAEKIEDKDEREKALAALTKDELEARKKHADRMAAIDSTVDRMEKETLRTDLDRDITGDIRAATMLSGGAEGGRGYNLSTGGMDDTIKAGLYIDEVAGNEGNLFDQMGLLENAVNSASLSPGREIVISASKIPVSASKIGVSGSQIQVSESRIVVKDKIHDLHSILSSMSRKDYDRMNLSREGGLGFSFEDLDTFRQEGKIETLMGQIDKSEGLSEGLFKQRETDAAEDRRKGSHISKLSKLRNHFSLGVNGMVARGGYKMSTTSMFGDFFTLGRRRAQRGPDTYEDKEGNVRKARSNYEKRLAQRQEDVKWFDQFGIALDLSYDKENKRYFYADKDIATWDVPKVEKDELTGNKADTSASLDEKIGAKDLSAIAKLQDAGFIRASVLETKKVEGKPDEVVKTLTGDKSARNMMTALKLLGGTEDDLLKFRLALIAYMVPTGKKTLYDIIDESKESGVSIDGIDLSEQGLLYDSFLRSTNALLGTNLAGEAEKPEDKKQKKSKAKPGEEQKEPEGPKPGLRLPMEIVRDYIEKEKKEKKKGEFANFQERKRSNSVPVPPKKPLPEIPKKKNPEDPKKDMGDAQTLEKFKNVFGDLSGQAGEIFGEGGTEAAARRLSEKLRAAASNDEKKTALKGIITEMAGAQGVTAENFWTGFVTSFGTAYLHNTVGAFNNSEFNEHTGHLIEFLTANDSDLKTMIMELFNEVHK